MAKTVVCDPAAAGRKVAYLPVEHSHGDGSVLNEGAEMALAGAQLFFSALAFGNVGGQAENILRLARTIAQEGKFDFCPNEPAIPEEIPLVEVAMIEFAAGQPLKRVQIR